MDTSDIRIGTCSWKYPSWEGLVYSKPTGINYLEEYARQYNTVEIDQWFWSLYGAEKVVLPRPEVVEEYASAVPADFRFTIKVPNSITLTHFYKKSNTGALQPNPHFLSKSLFSEFLASIEPLKAKVGMLMFQFEYLNKQKMSGQVQFLSLLADFFSALPHEYTYALEPRNPNYLNKLYFDFLNRHNLYHVFLEGYYMPPIVELYHLYKNYIKEFTAIRLHGAGRDEVEKETKEVWNRIVLPQDNELAHIIEMIKELNSRRIKIFINVNNHYEGSSPLTIKKITGLLHKRDNN